MNPTWQSFLKSCGAHVEAGELVHFGDARAELSAAESGTVLAPLVHFGLIRCTGEDAAPFLHNLLSNDVQHLGLDHAVRNSFCSPKGRMLADFLIWRDGPDYFLHLSADIQPAMLKKLGMYLLRSKAKLSDANDELVLVGISGTTAEDAVRTLGADIPQQPLGLSRFEQGCVIRLDDHRFELAVRSEAALQVWERLATAARPAGTPVWRWLDIAAGIPHITAATQEEFVPQMANFELIGGVSFGKGCYPGQEVVARMKYLGKIKRRTYRAHLADGACPRAGTDLYSPDLPPDQPCGKVIDAAPCPSSGCELLASMQISSAEAGDVRVGAVDGLRIEFCPLPYPLD